MRLGLLCHRCSHCSIPDLQDKAESLGIMSIVAEGFYFRGRLDTESGS